MRLPFGCLFLDQGPLKDGTFRRRGLLIKRHSLTVSEQDHLIRQLPGLSIHEGEPTSAAPSTHGIYRVTFNE